jgi:glycosidase
MRQKNIDEEIVRAWLEAAKDLGIRVVAPFVLRSSAGDTVYEAHILDFGGPKGTLVGVLEDDPPWKDGRKMHGYYGSNLAPSYRHYERQYFIETLNDWQWFGDDDIRPPWYTGKPWS